METNNMRGFTVFILELEDRTPIAVHVPSARSAKEARYAVGEWATETFDDYDMIAVLQGEVAPVCEADGGAYIELFTL